MKYINICDNVRLIDWVIDLFYVVFLNSFNDSVACLIYFSLIIKTIYNWKTIQILKKLNSSNTHTLYKSLKLINMVKIVELVIIYVSRNFAFEKELVISKVQQKMPSKFGCKFTEKRSWNTKNAIIVFKAKYNIQAGQH